jgi:outer membrane protein
LKTIKAINQMKRTIKILLLLTVCFTCYSSLLQAQDVQRYSLEQLTDSALRHNHTLAIEEWRVKEKQAKIKEDEIKRGPSATLTGNYLHSFNLGEITIPANTLGPSNPGTDRSFTVGNRNNSSIGMVVYQPITQQPKIKTGLEVDKTDVKLTEKERFKASLQIKQATEQLYYLTLITQKRLEEAEAKLELDKSKLGDVENALLAGKTITTDKVGLQANIADQEQNILKLNIQVQDYIGDLITVTGINATSLALQDIEPTIQSLNSLDDYQNAAKSSNADLQIAELNKSKAILGIKASRQSNLPEFGFVGGYAHQYGNAIQPANNPFVGVNLKWNLQDIFSNKQITRQRQFQLKQAEENIVNTQQQVSNDIEKAYRKINETKALIAVSQKAFTYRKEELKIQEDKQAAGLNMKTDLLLTKSLLAKSEADVYSSQLSYLMAISDLKVLTGQ